MKNRIINFIISICIIILFIWFWYISWQNYKKHIEIKNNIIEHPNYLPEKILLDITSLWYSNLKSDIYWLETIQYIWWNAIWSEYKKYLYNIIDIITHLNPYFEHPYLIWELLLPSYNQRYEKISKKEQNEYIKQWIQIWLKWIVNFCDKKKLELIKNEYNLNKLWTEEKYRNPCKSHMIPFYLAYIYFFYQHDWENASYYYRVASANTDSISWAKVMSAIMQWKSWDREKSILMFLNLAQNMDSNQVCNMFSKQIENIYIKILNKELILNWKLIKDIENLRKEIYGENTQHLIMDDTNCWSYLLKATRELNLYYIENANKKYVNDFWVNSIDADELFKKWYIDYNPVDFQQEKDYWVRYFFNEEIKQYDYKMKY